jgi:hypothetical protein
MPPEKTIRLVRGRAVRLVGRTAPPHELAGWSLAFTVRDGVAGSVVLTKTTGAGVTITDAGRGVVRIDFDAVDTSALTPSAGLAAGQGYVWDLSRTDTGLEQTLAAGPLILEGDASS